MKNFPKHLLDGYANFKSGRYTNDESQYRELAEKGQTPDTMIISCCDSRATPEAIFDKGPGALFVVRNVANLVQPYDEDESYNSVSAALEFAVQALKVKNIIVMGHAKCGGIKAALMPLDSPLSSGDFIGKWTALIADAAKEVNASQIASDDERQTVMEHVSVRNSIENLRSFPFVNELEEKGEVKLHGAWFDISSGELQIMDSTTGDFIAP